MRPRYARALALGAALAAAPFAASAAEAPPNICSYRNLPIGAECFTRHIKPAITLTDIDCSDSEVGPVSISKITMERLIYDDTTDLWVDRLEARALSDGFTDYSGMGGGTSYYRNGRNVGWVSSDGSTWFTPASYDEFTLVLMAFRTPKANQLALGSLSYCRPSMGYPIYATTSNDDEAEFRDNWDCYTCKAFRVGAAGGSALIGALIGGKLGAGVGGMLGEIVSSETDCGPACKSAKCNKEFRACAERECRCTIRLGQPVPRTVSNACYDQLWQCYAASGCGRSGSCSPGHPGYGDGQ